MEPRRDMGEDVSFFLYLAPIIASVVYGIVEWYRFGPHSNSMPAVAYVVVSKDPYLFLGSLAAVCLGFILEVRTTSAFGRSNIVSANATRMQILAIAVLIISFCAGISAGGYNVSSGGSNFLVGRYALIFAFFLLGFSILIAPRQLLGNVRISVAPELFGLLLMAISPFVYLGAHKLHAPFAIAASTGIIVLILGAVVLFAGPSLMKGRKSREKPRSTSSASQVAVSKDL